MRTAPAKMPADLAAAWRRLEKWRAGGRPRRPLPDNLWEMAADLVPRHGVYRVSQALRLEYYKVKERASARKVEQRFEDAPTFVEVASPPSSALDSLLGCTVELADESGRRMTIRSSMGLDAVALVAAFCGEAPCSR